MSSAYLILVMVAQGHLVAGGWIPVCVGVTTASQAWYAAQANPPGPLRAAHLLALALATLPPHVQLRHRQADQRLSSVVGPHRYVTINTLALRTQVGENSLKSFKYKQ